MNSLAEGASLVVADSLEAGNSSEAVGSLAVAGSSAADDSLNKRLHFRMTSTVIRQILEPSLLNIFHTYLAYEQSLLGF